MLRSTGPLRDTIRVVAAWSAVALVSWQAAANVREVGIELFRKPYAQHVRGLTAGTFQHEVDHLDGVLFVDRVKDPKTLCTWAEFDRYHKKDFVDRIVPFVQRMGG